MGEHTDYRLFRKHILRYGDRMDRIENVTVLGMPDINCCFIGTEFWIEQKSPTEPKRPTTPLFGSNHRVSTDQKNWFLAQRQAGGRAYFLITTNKRWMLLDGVVADMINGLTVDQLEQLSLWSIPRPAPGRKATRRYQWDDLRLILMS